jgi:hypothetical protein
MTSELRKALLYQVLPVIEPKRSNRANQLNGKALVCQWRTTFGQSLDRSIQINLTAISTVGGN